MERINFENGVTKVNEDIFNEFQDNIEEACVYTGATEPETSEKVWIKTSKNLANPEKLIAFDNTSININNENNPIVTQIQPDSNQNPKWKLQEYKNNTVVRTVQEFFNVTTGVLYATFTKTSDFDIIIFGVNGSTRDTIVGYNVSNLTNGETYTISWRVLNVTQGSISWDNIQLEGGETVNNFAPYIRNQILTKNKNGVFDELTMIESGSNTNGSWVKYPDGTMMCYNIVTYSGTRTASMTAGGYRTSGQNFTFPQTFISNPKIIVSDSSSAGTANGCSGSATTSMASIYWWGINSSSSSSSYAADYVAIGRWK